MKIILSLLLIAIIISCSSTNRETNKSIVPKTDKVLNYDSKKLTCFDKEKIWDTPLAFPRKL